MEAAQLFINTHEWIKKMCFVNIKWNIIQSDKNKIVPFAAMWMDLDSFILGEISPDGKKQTLYVITYMWNIKNDKHTVDLVCFL